MLCIVRLTSSLLSRLKCFIKIKKRRSEITTACGCPQLFYFFQYFLLEKKNRKIFFSLLRVVYTRDFVRCD